MGRMNRSMIAADMLVGVRQFHDALARSDCMKGRGKGRPRSTEILLKCVSCPFSEGTTSRLAQAEVANYSRYFNT
jgi:hypothetical protein